MFRAQPRPSTFSPSRDQVIFLGGLISAVAAAVLLLLAYLPG